MPDVIMKHVPGMRNASPVPVLNVEGLTESVFVGEYVSKSRPCIVRGAIKHWPAMQSWRDKEYLKARSGHRAINLLPHEYFVSMKKNEASKRTTSFAEAIDYLHARDTKAAMFATGVPVELAPDTNGFTFLGKTERAFSYLPLRYFFFRNAGTTWHYHPFDETLMSQVIGPKKIGLLKVTAQSRAVRDVFLHETYYDNTAAFDDIDRGTLQWFSANLEEGDALYIPPLWWHGVVPLNDSFGITTAACWRSPLSIIADSIRKMAAGEFEMIGMSDAAAEFPRMYALAQNMGLAKEFVTALRLGI